MAHIPLGSLPALNGARFDVIAQVELAVVHENVDVYAHAVVERFPDVVRKNVPGGRVLATWVELVRDLREQVQSGLTPLQLQYLESIAVFAQFIGVCLRTDKRALALTSCEGWRYRPDQVPRRPTASGGEGHRSP